MAEISTLRSAAPGEEKMQFVTKKKRKNDTLEIFGVVIIFVR